MGQVARPRPQTPHYAFVNHRVHHDTARRFYIKFGVGSCQCSLFPKTSLEYQGN